MKKRLFAAFLALVLALGMLPATALADETDAPTAPAPEDTLINSQEALQAALDNGVNPIRLDADITLTDDLIIDKSVTLDLDNHSLTIGDDCEGILAGMSDSDSVTIKNGKITASVIAVIVNKGTAAFENLEIAAGTFGILVGIESTAAHIRRCSIEVTGTGEYDSALFVADSPERAIDKITVADIINIILKEEAAETYYISIPAAEGGEVIPNTRYAAAGERVTLTAHPEDKYETDKITVTDMRGRAVTVRDMGKNQWSFVMPASKVDVTAVFAKIAGTEAPAQTNDIPGTSHTAASPDDEVFTGLGTPGVSGIVLNPAAMPFSDVRAGDWFYDSVEYVWKHYLMSGVSDTQFSPNAATTRGMIWTILARMNNIRTDINPGNTWYERGMLWCKEQGVTDGSEPMADITREQLAAMLWRSAGSPGGNGDLSKFSDSAKVSGYAESAVRWAVGAGVLNGSNGKLNPQGTATRAEVAAMVARYGDKVA